MILRKNQYIAKIGEPFERSTVEAYVFSGGVQRLGHKGYWIMLHETSLPDIFEKDDLAIGIPICFAADPAHNELVLWPRNESRRELSITYCPARKKI